MIDPVRNFALVTVLWGYTKGETEILLMVGDGAKIPNPVTEGNFNLVWWNFSDFNNPALDPNVEIVRCVGKTGDLISILRGQEDTLEADHNISGKAYKLMLTITKKTIDDIRSSLLSGLSLVKETPSGTVDDANKDFILSYTPILSTEQVFLNGLLQDEEDYTISGKIIEFTYAPKVGDKVKVSYFK